jgi:hypothetical protein
MIMEGESEMECYPDTSKGLVTEVSLLRKHVRELQGKTKELEGAVEDDLVKWSKEKLIVKPAEFTAREYAIQLPYHPEQAAEARMNLTPDAGKKETCQETAVSDLENMKNFFEYLITKQNQAIQVSVKEMERSMKEDRKALQDNMEKQHRELLECLHAETKKNTDLINQVKKVTEEEIIRVDERITKVREELEDKLEINSAQINSVVGELTNKVTVNEIGTEDKFQKLDKAADKVEREICQLKDTFKRKEEHHRKAYPLGAVI